METQYVKPKTALLLKDMGFRMPQYYGAFYDIEDKEYFSIRYDEKALDKIRLGDATKTMGLLLPTLNDVQRILRTEYDIDISIDRSFSMAFSYHYYILHNWDYDNAVQQESIPNRKYEQALEDAIIKACEIIKGLKN